MNKSSAFRPNRRSVIAVSTNHVTLPSRRGSVISTRSTGILEHADPITYSSPADSSYDLKRRIGLLKAEILFTTRRHKTLGIKKAQA